MRVAIVSDVHGSLRALEAVVADIERRSPDLIVHGGDLAVNGPRPAEVIDLIRELAWPGVLGNTDEMLWRPEGLAEQEARAPKLRALLRVMFEQTAPATADLIGEQRMDWLRQLGRDWRHEDLIVLHASPEDLWRAPLSDANDGALDEMYGGLGAGVVVYGHIHHPFVRKLGNLTVANSGSVGLSYDGDRRASYLLIDDGVPYVRRVEYEFELDIADLVASGYPYSSWLTEIKRTGRYVAPRNGQ